MYEAFYGLKSRPFQLTPDPHYYFESLTHRKALSYLGYGLAQGEGFIVITGDVGSGKTTLVSHLMATIDKARLTAANIVTTKLDGEDIVRVAADHFGFDTAGMDKAQLLGEFETFLNSEARAGRRCLLIVDESQNLEPGALEELRMLSNFQLGGQALLQIFLLGQPEFRDTLQNSDRLEQLRQRVIAHHHLEPMEAAEIEPYITHRLSKSGWSGRPKITSDVFGLIYGETQGVPRKINTLMSRVLLMGSVEHAELIDQALIGRVLADLNGDQVEISQPDELSEEQLAEQSPLWKKPARSSSNESQHGNEAGQSDIEAAPKVVPSTAEKASFSEQSIDNSVEGVVNEVKPDTGVSKRVDIISKRLSLLESRMNEQEENMHHILTMMVNWVESDIRSKESYINAGRAA